MFNGAVCGAVNYHDLYSPNLSTSSYNVSRKTAKRIEWRLKHATAGILLDEAVPLQWAINSHNESAMIGVLTYLQQSVCPSIGVTPTT
jgi:hypothetical protein